jgi:ribose transport system permease protein
MKTIIVKTIKTLSIPAAIYAIFLLIDFERFGNPNCLYTIFLQSIIPSITAYAVSFGFICGLFDLTIGSWIILSGLVGGMASMSFGIVGLIAGCMATSFVISLATGLLNWWLKLPSIVLTMGLAMVYEIVGKKLSGNFSFVSIDYDNAPLGAVPGILIVLGIAVILYYLIFNRTRFSCHMKAVGSNESIAKNAGVNPAKVKLFAFMLGSIFVGIAALLTISQSGSMGAQLNLGSIVMLFKPLMGVVIAVVLQPICNLAFGIIVSQVSINTIFIGLIAIGVSDTFQNVVLGLFLLIILIVSNNMPRVKEFVEKRNRRKLIPVQ